MAGGGSVITMPLLIFMGLDSATANGTNRVAVLVQNIAAFASFHQQKVTRIRDGVRMGIFTIPGALIGAFFAVKMGDALFQKVLGLVMIGIVVTLILPKPQLSAEAAATPQKAWLIYPAMFGIGFYGGFIQAGVGYLLMAALFNIWRLNLVQVNMFKIIISLIFTLPALAVFIYSGHVEWWPALTLSAGNAIGGWLGAHISVKKGERAIKAVLIVAIIIMAIKLLYS